MEADDLGSLDAHAAEPLRALNYGRPPPIASHASPHAFVCSDGRTYWVKQDAQCGLIAELVAGRLGVQLDAAPIAAPVEVPQQALPTSGAANHLLGLGVGMEDRPSMDNFRHITEKAPDGNLDPALLDPASVARVIVFQTWIGAGDTQILVDLRTGSLLSIDHGDVAAVSTPNSVPTITIAPGIPPEVARDANLIYPVVDRIEALTDEALLRAVAGAPAGGNWRSEPEHRLAFAGTLRLRRDRLREVMRQWLP